MVRIQWPTGEDWCDMCVPLKQSFGFRYIELIFIPEIIHAGFVYKYLGAISNPRECIIKNGNNNYLSIWSRCNVCAMEIAHSE